MSKDPKEGGTWLHRCLGKEQHWQEGVRQRPCGSSAPHRFEGQPGGPARRDPTARTGFYTDWGWRLGAEAGCDLTSLSDNGVVVAAMLRRGGGQGDPWGSCRGVPGHVERASEWIPELLTNGVWDRKQILDYVKVHGSCGLLRLELRFLIDVVRSVK